MRTNWVRENLRAGQPAIGCFLGLGSPNVAEMLAHAGYDWLIIETEHNGLDSAEIEHMLMAMKGTGTIPIVRVASANPVFIQRALDMGAMGILVPMVKTAEEAEAIVRATRYPPQGARSFGPLRGAAYSLDNTDYLTRANDNILVILILETKEAVANLEAIAAVPGIDALFLGPYDLCLSMGLNPLDLPLPEVDAVIERLLAVSRDQDVVAGSATSTPDGLRELQEQGFTLLSYGQDYSLLLNAAREGLAAFGRKPVLDL